MIRICRSGYLSADCASAGAVSANASAAARSARTALAYREVVHFGEEQVLPGLRRLLERADAGHEARIFHGGERRHGPLHLRTGDDRGDLLERQLRLDVLDPVA